MQNLRAKLEIGIYTLHFRMEDAFLMPVFAGNLWRSVLGLHLRQMSEGKASAPAHLPDGMHVRDLYRYFMETPPPPDATMMRRYPAAPHPYVLAAPVHDAPMHLQAGDSLQLRLILFGRANALLNVVLLAFSRAVRQGLGRQRARGQLVRVEEHSSAIAQDKGEPRQIFAVGEAFVPPQPAMLPLQADTPAPSIVRVHFHTPLRLAINSRILPPARFTPYPLLMNLLRRLSALDAFHGSGNPQVNAPLFKQAAQQVLLLEPDLQWRDLKRYSARSRKEVPMGGIVGTCMLDISKAPEIWPLLRAGQHVHAGKGAVMGLGAMRVETC